MVCAVCLSSVYKVRVESVKKDLTTDLYSMRIMTVIKEGGSLLIIELSKTCSSPLLQLLKKKKNTV